jgi:hypothetical protein
MSDISTGDKAPPPQGSLLHLGLSALGVVFGDLGTSPLYTFKTILKLVGEARFHCDSGGPFARPLDVFHDHLYQVRFGGNAHR